MRILLVQSFLGRREKPIYPLGLAYLAASLKGHELKAFDPNVATEPIDELKKTARAYNPELIGLSLRNLDTTSFQDPFVYLTGFIQTLNALKETLPHVPIIAGGAGFSIYAKELMNMFPQIDAGAFLEAEDSFPELIQKFPAVENVPGFYYRKNGAVVYSGDRTFPNFTELPFPDWKTVPMEPYRDLLDSMGVQTKRGCGLKCAYCNYPFLNGSCYRFRSPESVGEEIERLVKDYKAGSFIFVDSVFNLPKQHCEAVLNEIIRRKIGIKWTGWYNERNMDREFVDLTKRAGCEVYAFSPDGYSEKSLDALGKNLRKKDILRAYDLVKSIPGAKISYNFFIDPPEQTFGSLIKMIMFGVKAKIQMRGRIICFHLGSIRIEPDTPIYQRALQEGQITEKTPMIAKDSGELMKLFYSPPKSWKLNLVKKMYILYRLVRNFIKPLPQN